MDILDKQSLRLLWGRTVFVFLFVLAVGYFLSTKKPLENDELFTQISSVEGLSYQGILTAKIPEGNVSPLFYFTQKAFLDALSFRLPFSWKGEWFVYNLPSQIALRVLSNVFMSLSVTIVFYFFARFYSVWAGVYGSFVMLASFMTLTYWALGRPYALWNFLTTLQVLLFLYILRTKQKNRLAWTSLAAVHFLLALTVTFGAVQITAVSLVLFFSKERSITQYVFLTVVPVVLCFAYYFSAPKYSFYFSDSPLQLICASFPKDRLAFVFLLGAVLAVAVLVEKKQTFVEKLKESNMCYLFFIVVILFLTAVLMGLFYIKAHGKNEGFPLSNRYFIYLSPIGAIALVLFTVETYKSFAGKFWFKVALCLVAGAALIFRFNWSWLLAKSAYGL